MDVTRKKENFCKLTANQSTLPPSRKLAGYMAVGRHSDNVNGIYHPLVLICYLQLREKIDVGIYMMLFSSTGTFLVRKSTTTMMMNFISISLSLEMSFQHTHTDYHLEAHGMVSWKLSKACAQSMRGCECFGNAFDFRCSNELTY